MYQVEVSRSIGAIASDIKREWGSKVNYAAAPYLDAMGQLWEVDDKYGHDDGRDIILRFLANAGTFRGPIARAIKAELKGLLKNGK